MYILSSLLSFEKKNQPSGFTFVELIIVSALMMVLLGLSVPFVTSLRSELSMSGTLRQVKTDVVTTMGYALAGKSIAALTSGDLNNPELIPSHYALFFQADDDYGNPTPYSYVECTTEILNRNQYNTKSIYSIEKDMPSETVILKDIRLKMNESDSGQSVDSAFIFFSSPFAKVNLFNGHKSLVSDSNYTFNSIETFKNTDFNYIDLVFQFKDDKDTRTIMTFGVDKVINIS